MKKLPYIRRFLLLFVFVLVTYFSFTIGLAPYKNAVNAVSFRWGARGGVVYQIQRRLKAWGYYKGGIDGIYGYRTYTAVKKFQAKNGMRADGVTGDRTLAALGINVPKKQSSGSRGGASNSSDVMLLARLINGEARGEPYEGQVAVGATVVNRTRDPRFPSTIAGVIYQPGAFTAIVDGQIGARMEKTSINAAKDAINGWDPSGGAVFYYNPSKTTNRWIWSRPVVKVIGQHKFCK